MSAKITKLPQIASPSIDKVLEDFLADQRRRLKPKTVSKYESVVELLQHHLNGYAYDGLSKVEAALFDNYFNAEGEEHREFCQLFGPEKILENVGMFLSYYMVRKVMAGQDLLRAAGTVTKKLAKWLADKGYVSREDAKDGADMGAQAARDLPNAERASMILYESAGALPVNVPELEDKDYLDFNHHTITKIEPGKLWIDALTSAGRTELGPIVVPKKATELLEPGWDISCALGRIQGKWRIIEVGNVYPS